MKHYPCPHCGYEIPESIYKGLVLGDLGRKSKGGGRPRKPIAKLSPTGLQDRCWRVYGKKMPWSIARAILQGKKPREAFEAFLQETAG